MPQVRMHFSLTSAPPCINLWFGEGQRMHHYQCNVIYIYRKTSHMWEDFSSVGRLLSLTYIYTYAYIYIYIHIFVGWLPTYGKTYHMWEGFPCMGKSSHIWEAFPRMGRLPTHGKTSQTIYIVNIPMWHNSVSQYGLYASHMCVVVVVCVFVFVCCCCVLFLC